MKEYYEKLNKLEMKHAEYMISNDFTPEMSEKLLRLETQINNIRKFIKMRQIKDLFEKATGKPINEVIDE